MELLVPFVQQTLVHWWPVVLVIVVGTACVVVLEFDK